MKNAINWFEIPALDFDRAANFYDSILSKPLRRESFMGIPHAIFPFDAECVGGAVVKMEELKPAAEGTTVYINVDGYLDQVIQSTPKAGGKILMDKMSIGEHGFIALISDTEGNRVGLHSMQ